MNPHGVEGEEAILMVAAPDLGVKMSCDSNFSI